jgi:hypothetical protein
MPIAIPITSLPAASQVLSTDIYVAVDTTDHTDAPTGTDKQYTVSQLNSFLGVSNSSNKLSARLGSTANLTATYNNGTLGVGATLTNSGTLAAFALDGVSANVNDRVLIKDQSTKTQNGIYVVTTVGSGSVAWVLTRSSDYNNSTAGQVVEGTFVGVSEGSVNTGTLWMEVGVNPIVIGTNNIIFQNIANDLAGVLPLDKGGTNNNLTAIAGGIVYSDNTKLDILAAGTTGQVLQSKGATAPSWSTPTYPSSSGTLNSYLTSNGTNNIYSPHTLNLGGNVITQGAVSFLGAFSSTFNFTAGTNVTFPTSGTLATTSEMFMWNNITTSQSLVPNNGYTVDSGIATTLLLPTTAAYGTIIRITNINSGNFTIAQNAGQSILFGLNTTTVGTGGSISSTNQGDAIELLCIVTNTIWQVSTGPLGNFTIV